MARVPNKEIREAFLRSGYGINDVCRWAGWLKKNGAPDVTSFGRALGLLPNYNHRSKKKHFQKNINETTALRIIEALGLDPVDFREIGL